MLLGGWYYYRHIAMSLLGYYDPEGEVGKGKGKWGRWYYYRHIAMSLLRYYDGGNQIVQVINRMKCVVDDFHSFPFG